jgi:hexosaminidase
MESSADALFFVRCWRSPAHFHTRFQEVTMLASSPYLRLRFVFLPMLFCLCACSPAQQRERPIAITPKPVELTTQQGYFKLTKSTTMLVSSKDRQLVDCATWFANSIRPATGFQLKGRPAAKAAANSIFLQLDPDPQFSREGYALTVKPDRVEIRAADKSGIFYGLQTFLQLLPPEIYSDLRLTDIVWDAPCVTIRDAPRFAWRGMHLDVSRHFFAKDFIKTYIDMLAAHKMNTFHWHLCDDQGWRIEIKKYPKLTQVGAWRVDREQEQWNARRLQKEDEQATYGGFYTQDDIREIVAYAETRCVTIVPEIEMPAHCMAALSAYPEYSCTGGPFSVPPGGIWPLSDIFCAGNDGTFRFLEDVLDEVCALFPSKLIHIGGDEADKARWKSCAKCQARIRTEHLKDEAELQSYFVKRIEKVLQSKNRRLIGWDEILEGGLAPDATVMSWRGMEGGIAAAKQNHDVVMTPGSHCYFDHYQGRSEVEPTAIGGFTPLSKVYAFEPIPSDLPAEYTRHVLGAQGNVWTEYIGTPLHVQYMTLPRMAALAEVLWSPKEARNWDDFTKRIEAMTARYEVHSWNYAKSAWLVSFQPAIDTTTHRITVAMSTELPVEAIRYTTDHSDPTASADTYTTPFPVQQTTALRAVGFMRGHKFGKPTEKTFYVHKALLKQPQLAHRYEQYTAGGPYGLVDGVTGSDAYNDGFWQGYRKDDLDAVIDLGTATKLKSIESHFLENTYSWIFLPRTVDVSTSDDGVAYTLIATIDMPLPQWHQPVKVRNFVYDFKNVTARYVRLTARNIGICPDWHGGKGESAWLFVDEIIVE